jgi:hypothetical protein
VYVSFVVVLIMLMVSPLIGGNDQIAAFCAMFQIGYILCVYIFIYIFMLLLLCFIVCYYYYYYFYFFFSLASYGLTNVSCFIHNLIGAPNWRSLFKYSNTTTAFAGLQLFIVG